jgi:hypothetical protein
MNITILKGIISVYGVMVPGRVIEVPEHTGNNWIKNGIARYTLKKDADAAAKAEKEATKLAKKEATAQTPEAPRMKRNQKPEVEITEEE